MAQQFTNNARALLTASITTTATSIVIESAKADLFPVANVGAGSLPSANSWFKATLQDATGAVEIVYVRTRTAGSGVLSNVIRAQEGTTAVAFAAGTVIGLRVTAADIQTALDLPGASSTFAGNNTFSGANTFSGINTAPTAAPGTNTTQIATTAFSDAAIIAERTATATLTNKSLTSPTLTGTPTAPTAALNTNDTQVATTAFVVAQIADDAPTKTGTGASGTWGINITGNAATVTTVTTSQILAALASASLGAVGTYAWLITVPDATVTEGSTVAGSSLRYSGVYTDGSGNSGWPTGSAPSGTWRAMGTTLGGYGRTGTLFLRIS